MRRRCRASLDSSSICSLASRYLISPWINMSVFFHFGCSGNDNRLDFRLGTWNAPSTGSAPFTMPSGTRYGARSIGDEVPVARLSVKLSCAAGVLSASVISQKSESPDVTKTYVALREATRQDGPDEHLPLCAHVRVSRLHSSVSAAHRVRGRICKVERGLGTLDQTLPRLPARRIWENDDRRSPCFRPPVSRRALSTAGRALRG
jgi:hypothetical protein